MDEIARRIAGGPAHFAHQIDLDADTLLFVELDEAAIAGASFLDQRVLGPQVKGGWAPMADVLARAGHAARDDAAWIFHIGHVGSTLVSRLLDRVPSVLGLREPLVLRALADAVARAEAPDAPWEPSGIPARAALIRRLLSRTFRPDQRAIVKATSFTSEVAPLLVAPGARALFLHVSPESYLATIMAGEASRRELKMLTGARLTRLARAITPMTHRRWHLGEGEAAALGYAVEMLSLARAEGALPPGAVLRVDFDALLGRPAETLTRIAAHFGLALDDPERLARDPVMTRYSKAPEHGYSPQLRADVQAQAAREHREALAQGRAWLDALAREHASVAEAMGRG